MICLLLDDIILLSVTLNILKLWTFLHLAKRTGHREGWYEEPIHAVGDAHVSYRSQNIYKPRKLSYEGTCAPRDDNIGIIIYII